MEPPGAQGFPEGDWTVDWSSPFEFTAHARLETLHREVTPFQRIEIVRTADCGRCLLLDGDLQSCEADEFIYHEALVHPALILHPDPRRVLVIGGGEGATLREVLRHRSVELARMGDLDERVVAAARTHLDTFHAGAFDEPRARPAFGDGRAFLETSAETWDAVFASAYLRRSRTHLVVRAEDSDFTDLVDGYAGRAVADLVDMAATGGVDAEDAGHALSLLYRLVDGGTR